VRYLSTSDLFKGGFDVLRNSVPSMTLQFRVLNSGRSRRERYAPGQTKETIAHTILHNVP
jgi:hypothetical protein